jgi:DNA transposition AAA+ family ATPase
MESRVGVRGPVAAAAVTTNTDATRRLLRSQTEFWRHRLDTVNTAQLSRTFRVIAHAIATSLKISGTAAIQDIWDNLGCICNRAGNCRRIRDGRRQHQGRLAGPTTPG